MSRIQCEGCRFALWKRTKAGRLHPDGSGQCEYALKEIQIPAAKYWLNKPLLGGGYISRHEPLKRPCGLFQRALDQPPATEAAPLPAPDPG